MVPLPREDPRAFSELEALVFVGLVELGYGLGLFGGGDTVAERPALFVFAIEGFECA